MVPVDLGIVGDCAEVLEQLVSAWDKREARDLTEWQARIAGWRARHCLAYPQSSDAIMPQKSIERLFALTRDRDPIITTEVGQHQMWAAQHFGFAAPNRWLTSGGLGTLPETLDGKARAVSYRSIRYPGHCDILKMLLHDLGLERRRDLMKEIFESALPRTDQDVVLVYCTARGRINGELREKSLINKI